MEQSGTRAGVLNGRQARRRMLMPVLVSIGMVVAVVSSLGAPMVPTVADEYQVSLGTAQWTLTIALLAGAVVTPVLGRLGDGRYRREVVLGALGLIATGGILAAIPGAFGLLLGGRALQGVGVGLMPLAMSIARDHVPGERAPSAVALLSITTATGVGIGYPLSGFCAETIGFHATFILAAVVATVVAVGAFFTIPSSRARTHRPVDLIGASMMSVGVATLVIALSETSSWGIASWRVLILLAVSASAWTAWAVHERRAAVPLVDLRTLASPSVRVAHGVAVLAGIGMFLLMSLVIRFVQTPTSTGYGQGRSVLVAGAILVPLSVASLASNRLLPRLGRRFGPQWAMPLGCVALIAAVALFALRRSGLWEVLAVMALSGIGVGIVFASMPMCIVAAVPATETGSALGFNQVLRTIGSSVGSAVSAAVLAAHTGSASPFPLNRGYTQAAMIGIGVWTLALIVAWPRPSLSLAHVAPGAPDHFGAESVEAEAAGVIMYEMDSVRPRSAEDKR